MAASVLLLAWAGLSSVSGAAQLYSPGNDVVTRVISGLNIQGAVAQARAGRSQGVTSTRSQGVTRTRTQAIGNGEWSEWTTVNPSSQVTVNTVNTFPASQLANTRLDFSFSKQQTLELFLF